MLNDASGSVRLGGYGRIIEGSEPTNNLHGQSPPPPYEFPRDLEPGDGQVRACGGLCGGMAWGATLHPTRRC